MTRSLSLLTRRSRPSTLGPTSGLRVEVCPPSLRCEPGTTWQRWLFWLLAPAPEDASLPPSRMPAVRVDFMAALADVQSPEAQQMRDRIAHARSMRDLWHVRAELFRLIGLAHSQFEAEQRLSQLNRHFPTRAPRSQFAPL